jgi:hypothetical protein
MRAALKRIDREQEQDQREEKRGKLTEEAARCR